MIISNFTEEWIPQAMELLRENYEEEKAFVPSLPKVDNYWEMECFARNGMGVVATEKDCLIGFLCGWEPFRPVFCTPDVTGVWSPLHAHAAQREKRISIYRRMYQAAAEKWAKAGASSHAITLFAHDVAAREAFYMYSFGVRCMDFMSELRIDEACTTVEGIRFCEIPRERSMEITPLRRMLSEHLSHSPCFMKQTKEDEERWLENRVEDSPRIFAAEKDGKWVGYLEVVPNGENGENYISCQKGVWNICGAYCSPSQRGNGTAAGILQLMKTSLAKEGVRWLGVDCESINPTALGFWTKHFDAYTHSVVRRIDENVLLK